MGFYRRYGGLPVPVIREATQLPAPIAPRIVGTREAIVTVPPPAATYAPEVPRFPIAPAPAKMLFVEPRKIETMVPQDIRPAIVKGADPAPARSAEADLEAMRQGDRATKAAEAAALRAQQAADAKAKAIVTAEQIAASRVFTTNKTADSTRAAQAAAEADRAASAARSADSVAAAQAQEALLRAAKADEERIKKAAEDALKESRRSQLYNEANPPAGGGGGGGSSYDPAYDPQEAKLVEVPLADGTTAGVTVSTQSPMLAIALAAGGGFLVGGPVGALVGAAATYFLKKPKLASQISYYRR